MKKGLKAAALAAVFLLAVATGATAQNLGSGLRIDKLHFNVTLQDIATGAAVPCTMVGHLYYLGTLNNRILQVAVHGATYNHRYWDFPDVNGENYSYARYMANRNYAVLAIDQVGAGESCRPNGLTVVNLQNTASALVQILASLRDGTNPTGVAFERIALVGHSAGSINAIAAQAATGSRGADALVVTAARHIVSPPLPPGIAAVLPLLPSLAALDYFSLDAATRTFLFFHQPAADPDVIALDNATADEWTGGQVQTTFVAFAYALFGLPPLDGLHLVTGPVLIQLGEFDALFPAAAPEQEAAQWASTTVEIQQLADMGHDFNLHRGREESWRGIDAWLRRTLR